jgi:hypothetical protein
MEYKIKSKGAEDRKSCFKISAKIEKLDKISQEYADWGYIMLLKTATLAYILHDRGL